MKLPRFLFNPLARHYFMLWRIEKRGNAQLKAELRQEKEARSKDAKAHEEKLREWQNRVLTQANIRPIPAPHPDLPAHRPPTANIDLAPIGPTAKRDYLARQQAKEPINTPTAEQILASAKEVQRKSA